MTDPDDRSRLNVPDETNVFAKDGRYPSGEGVSETPIHAAYEAIALRNDLARQLESVVVGARAWARADGTPESQATAEALAEIYDRVGTPPKP
jgi:hypothetical protein